MLVGGQNRYRGKFKQWCAEASMVCWWVGKKHIEEDSNIGELKPQWCAGGWAKNIVKASNIGELKPLWCAGGWAKKIKIQTLVC